MRGPCGHGRCLIGTIAVELRAFARYEGRQDMKTSPSSGVRYLIVSLLLGFASGCSSDSGDEGGASDHDKATAICDAYEDVHDACGYEKFDSRAACDGAFRQLSDADQDKALAFYACLAACKDGSSQVSVDDLSGACYAMYFQTEDQAAFRAACEPDCKAVVASGCSDITLDECMSNCGRSWSRCPNEVLAVAQCGHAYECTSGGQLITGGCAAEEAALSTCYNSITPGHQPQPQPPSP